ncbi:hypothetical protein B484DRAFT_425161, partial [Ochromonadaceae sp. CCMP2298]
MMLARVVTSAATVVGQALLGGSEVDSGVGMGTSVGPKDQWFAVVPGVISPQNVLDPADKPWELVGAHVIATQGSAVVGTVVQVFPTEVLVQWPGEGARKGKYSPARDVALADPLLDAHIFSQGIGVMCMDSMGRGGEGSFSAHEGLIIPNATLAVLLTRRSPEEGEVGAGSEWEKWRRGAGDDGRALDAQETRALHVHSQRLLPALQALGQTQHDTPLLTMLAVVWGLGNLNLSDSSIRRFSVPEINTLFILASTASTALSSCKAQNAPVCYPPGPPGSLWPSAEGGYRFTCVGHYTRQEVQPREAEVECGVTAQLALLHWQPAQLRFDAEPEDGVGASTTERRQALLLDDVGAARVTRLVALTALDTDPRQVPPVTDVFKERVSPRTPGNSVVFKEPFSDEGWYPGVGLPPSRIAGSATLSTLTALRGVLGVQVHGAHRTEAPPPQLTVPRFALLKAFQSSLRGR